MIIRELKLKPTAKQSSAIDHCLWQLVSVYNTVLTKCFIGLKSGRIPTPFELYAEFTGHGKKSGINQNAVQEICNTVRKAFDRWLFIDESGKRSDKPRRKSKRNKITSIIYGQASRITMPRDRKINVPGFGRIRCSKNEIPAAKIKGGRLIKRASGYYFQVVLDMQHTQEVKQNAPAVGIDPGFKTLLTLSDGTKFENPKEFRKTETRLAQAQRGTNKSLTARINERIQRQRKDRNHKISFQIVRDYSKIYASDDSFKGMQKHFGKSIGGAGLGSLLSMISYKSQTCGRMFVRVNSKNTTRSCSVCGGLHGPTGLSNLGVREWTCRCGASHDRDINAAQVVLLSGQGMPSVEKVCSDRA